MSFSEPLSESKPNNMEVDEIVLSVISLSNLQMRSRDEATSDCALYMTVIPPDPNIAFNTRKHQFSLTY